jgi:hypothetical protein
MKTIDRYVYHPAWEPNPHPYASAGENIVGLGYIMENPIVRGLLPNEGLSTGYIGYKAPPPIHPVCPAWGCSPPPQPVRDCPPGAMCMPAWPVHWNPYPGPTNLVPQPPPPTGPISLTTQGQNPPVSPAPAPTVAVPTSQTAPQLTQPGTTLDSSGASITTASGIGSWLGESTLITGIPNWGIAAAGVFAAMMLFGKGGRR